MFKTFTNAEKNSEQSIPVVEQNAYIMNTITILLRKYLLDSKL